MPHSIRNNKKSFVWPDSVCIANLGFNINRENQQKQTIGHKLATDKEDQREVADKLFLISLTCAAQASLAFFADKQMYSGN